MRVPKEFFAGIATLTGAIIGAGILGIPYVAVRAGFWTTMLVLAVIGFGMLVVHLLLGEITLRSRECHQLTGYAEKYLGGFGKFSMTVSVIIGCYGAMLAYTLGVSESLMSIFGGSQWLWILAFYILMAWLVHGGIGALGASELAMEVVKFFIFLVIAGVLFSSDYFNPANLSGFSWDRVMLPFGVILFAVIGTAAIPQIRNQTNNCSRLTRKAIIIGSVIPLIIYALFTAMVVGVSGGATTEVATIGLAQFTGKFGFILLQLFAILAMSSSFVVMGFALKETFWFDYKLKYLESWVLTMAVPLILILIGFKSFFRTLDIAGTFAGGIAGLLIVLIHAKARKLGKRTPEYSLSIGKISYGLLILLFSIGILYQFLLLF